MRMDRHRQSTQAKPSAKPIIRTAADAFHEPSHFGQAAAALKAAGIRYKILTKYQIKVGEYSFYPSRGTIFRDGDPTRHKQQGINAFIQLLRSNLRLGRH